MNQGWGQDDNPINLQKNAGDSGKFNTGTPTADQQSQTGAVNRFGTPINQIGNQSGPPQTGQTGLTQPTGHPSFRPAPQGSGQIVPQQMTPNQMGASYPNTGYPNTSYPPAGHPVQGYSTYPQPYAGYQMGFQQPPPSYLVVAIVGIFFCWPLSLVSLIYAVQVNSLWYQGNQAAAINASRNAKGWGIASLGISAVIIGFYFFAIIAGVLAEQ